MEHVLSLLGGGVATVAIALVAFALVAGSRQLARRSGSAAVAQLVHIVWFAALGVLASRGLALLSPVLAAHAFLADGLGFGAVWAVMHPSMPNRLSRHP